ncbi:hypothetical protein LUZ60_002834 [Juncus effusus]|nr:hypothetical protein LUZ60_002834 [Juncus effusus]
MELTYLLKVADGVEMRAGDWRRSWTRRRWRRRLVAAALAAAAAELFLQRGRRKKKNRRLSEDRREKERGKKTEDCSLDEGLVKGKIVVCDRGVNLRTAKGEVVRKAGGAGMILANGIFDGEGLVADSHVVPATAIAAKAGEKLRKYISSAEVKSPPMGTIIFRGTRLGIRPAPVVAAFSARGPSSQSPDIIKPDLIAPGLNILAAWPAGVGPAGIQADSRRAEFNILSGTSMACPHVSGLVALLKAAHPKWTPAVIKSALMTTAYVRDNANGSIIDESTGSPAGVFDFGSGHVDPQRAMDPGLVYDVSPAEYLNFLCGLNYTDQNLRAITRRPVNCNSVRRAGRVGSLNYPSFAASFIAGGKERFRFKKQFVRTVTNVGGPSVYRAVVREPEGSTVRVEPGQLVFRRTGQKLSYVVRLEAEQPDEKMEPGSSRVSSGSIAWTDGRHYVNSPVVVSVQAPLE